jgi:hypothetical protein
MTGTIFLLDMSGSSIAEAVADVDRVGKLTKALRFAETDKRSANSELKVRRKDQVEAQRESDRYKDLDQVDGEVAQTVANLSLVRGKIYSAQVAQNIRFRMLAARESVQKTSWVEQVVVPTQDQVQRASQVHTSLIEASRLCKTHRAHNELVRKLDGIRTIPQPVGVQGAEEAVEALVTATTLRTRLRSARSTLEGVEARTGGLSQASFTTFDGVSAKASKVLNALNSVKSLRSKLVSSKLELDNIQAQVLASEEQLRQQASEVSTLLGNLGECPTCGTIQGDSK